MAPDSSFYQKIKSILKREVSPELESRVLHSIDQEFERAIRLAQTLDGSPGLAPDLSLQGSSSKNAFGFLFSGFGRWVGAGAMIAIAAVIFLRMDPRPREWEQSSPEIAEIMMEELEDLSEESGMDLLKASDEEWEILLAEEKT
jgi:hypothetical protein